MAVLVQIDAYDPATAAAVTLRAASHDDDGVCGVGGSTWWPTISKLPSLAYDLFGGDFGDNITAPSTSFAMTVEPWPDFARYQIADARVRVWTGKIGDAAFTLRFDGRASSQPEIDDGVASISIAVDDSWLDAPLLATYAGTGGIEGGIDLTGTVKPLALGAPRYAAGTLIDSTNSVFQLSAYGAVQGFEAALEKLARFLPAVGDYATYDALVAATVPAGAWATSRATGLTRFGAPPAGQISFLLQGDAAGPDGWARLPGQIIRRVAQIAGGLAKVSDASLNALDAARPWALSNVIVQQTTAREVIQSIAASVNAVAGISWLGQLFVIPVSIGDASVTLDATGAALPPVASVSQAACDAPWWRLAIGAVRCWTVHALSDIAFDAALTPRGAYSDATVYREGDIVTVADGSRWLYTSTTPSSGHPPPNLTYWQPFSADAQVALDRIKAIESDSVLSAGEKAQTILFWTQVDRERAALEAQASSRGVNYAAYEGAYQSLANYLGGLSPAWSDTTQDTPIDPATFNQRWSDYYQQRTLLLNAVTADVGAAANEAAAEASAAIAQIGVIASDNWLSKGEKPAAIADWTAIDQENGILNAEAQIFGYDENNPGASAGSQAIANLNAAKRLLDNYLNTLGPAWNDTSQDTPIDGPTFRAKFASYYSAKATLLSAFAVSASRVASWDGVYGTGKDQLLAQAAAAASDAQGALRQLGVIASDGYLSRGEKSQVIADWTTISNEAAPLQNQAAALGVDYSQLANARQALADYLNSLSPYWADTSQDTAINASTFRGRFNDYYYAKVALENAMAQASAQSIPVVNRVKLSQFERGLIGWAAPAYNPQNMQPADDGAGNSGIRVGSYLGKPYLGMLVRATGGGQIISLGTSQDLNTRYKVTPGERLCGVVGFQTYGPCAYQQLTLWYYRADGSASQVKGNDSVSRNGQYAYDDRMVVFGDVPSDAVFGRIEGYAISSDQGVLNIAWTQPMVCAVSRATTSAPAFVAGPNSEDGADVTKTAYNSLTGQNPEDTVAQANAARSIADAANGTAASVQAFATDVADNNRASPEEKKRYQQKVQEYGNQVAQQVSKAQALGIYNEAANYQNTWNTFYSYLVNTVQIGNTGSRTQIDRNYFLSLSTAFTAAEKTLAVAIQNWAQLTSQHTTSNMFLDPRFERIADQTAWTGFDGSIVVQDSGDGRRIQFPDGQGGQNAYSFPCVFGPNDRIDFECEYYIEGAVGGAPGVGANFDLFDGSGNYIATFSLMQNGYTARRNQWTRYAASGFPSYAGGNWGSTASVKPHLYADGRSGGSIYLRNPRAYRVPAANALLNASGRGTSTTISSTNGVAGIRSLNLTGFALTQTKQTNSVTINVSQSQYYLDTGVTLTYPSASFGGYAYSTTYYFWRDDPNLDGGSGYGSSTNAQDALAPGRVYLGYITTQTASGTGGGGGGGGTTGCVAPDMFVEIEGAAPTRARDVRAGDRILCLTADMAGTEFVEVEASRPALNLRCRLVADSGEELDLATNTPVPRERGGYDMAGNAWTAPVPVGGAGEEPAWRRAVAEALPWGAVQRISCGGRVYGAGREPGRYIFTHNAVAKP